MNEAKMYANEATPDKASQKSTDVRIVVESKLMKSYYAASAVNGGVEAFSLRNRDGDVELFTVGDDGAIWNFYPDQTSGTGYASVQTELRGTVVAAGVDAQGRMVIFAGAGLQIGYVYQCDGPGRRWSQLTMVSVPGPEGPIRIDRVRAALIAGKLYIGALMQFDNAGHRHYFLSWATLEDVTCDPLNFVRSNEFISSSLHCAWIGNSVENASFVVADQAVVAYNVKTGSYTRYNIDEGFRCDDLGTTLERVHNSHHIFAILQDGNLYQLTRQDDTAYRWTRLTESLSFRQLHVDTNEEGGVQIAAVAIANQL